MKLFFRIMDGLLGLIVLASAGYASPIVLALNGIVLSDGGTATGTFTFNPDGGTPCGSFGPCGTYSNVHIVTTNGSSRTGTTYSFVCGEDVTACTGVSPDSTEVMFLTSNAANQTGDSALALFFTGIGVFPPNGLTDAGGTIDVSGSSTAVGIVTEGSCATASCSSPVKGSSRMSIAGTVSAVPEPASWLLVFGALGIAAPVKLASNKGSGSKAKA
jgi:hypothetical protein